MDPKSWKYLNVTLPLVLGVLGFVYLLSEQHGQLKRFEDVEQELEVLQAGSIKSWSNGEVIRAVDLNTNMNHLHDNMVGGHGARLVDADVSASAALSHAKFATPALVSRAWGTVASTCSTSPCTVVAHSKVSAITRASAGIYNVTLTYTPTNAGFAVNITQSTSGCVCRVGTKATASPHFIIACTDFVTPTPGVLDCGFDFTVMDDN